MSKDQSLLTLPILNDVLPKGLSYGEIYLVEFNADSLWQETSFTFAASALSRGIKTEYHTFMRPPREIRADLSKIGLDPQEYEKKGLFRIMDSYSACTDLPLPKEPRFAGHTWQVSKPTYVEDVASGMKKMMTEGVEDLEKRWLHIDDNTGVMSEYLEEKEGIKLWETKIVPYTRARELVAFPALVSGVWSDAFYRQFEALSDGVIEFQRKEQAGEIENYVRVRRMRGMNADSHWHRIKLLSSGEVAIDEGSKPSGELGLKSWLKGQRKRRSEE